MKIPRSFKTSNERDPSRPNIWGAIENIVRYTNDEGKFYAALVGTGVIIILVRISPEDLAKLVNRIFN